MRCFRVTLLNVFVPAMIAVLLAECGGRAASFLQLPKLSLAAVLLGLSVGIAAFAGLSMAPTMNAHARALLLGIALVLTGFGQFGKAPGSNPPVTVIGTIGFVWRSGAPFLAFAFSIWKASPVSAASGALAGVAAAVALGALSLGPLAVVRMRRSAGVLMTIVGIFTSLWALRLIG